MVRPGAAVTTVAATGRSCVLSCIARSDCCSPRCSQQFETGWRQRLKSLCGWLHGCFFFAFYGTIHPTSIFWLSGVRLSPRQLKHGHYLLLLCCCNISCHIPSSPPPPEAQPNAFDTMYYSPGFVRRKTCLQMCRRYFFDPDARVPFEGGFDASDVRVSPKQWYRRHRKDEGA